MDSTAYLVLSWIALAFMGLMLFLALFEPSLPYRLSNYWDWSRRSLIERGHEWLGWLLERQQ